MKQTLQKLSMLLLMMVIGIGSSWAQSDYSKTHDSNVTLSTEGGTKVNACVIQITDATGATVGYAGLKAGTASLSGTIVVKVPAGSKYLHLHVAGWKGSNPKVTVTGAIQTSINATGDDGITNNTPFSFSGDASSESFYKVLIFDSPLQEDTNVEFSSTNRFVIWGVNAEEAGATQKITTSIAHPTADNNNGVINAELGMEDPFFGIFVINTDDGSRIENPVLTYSSSNENVATIDESGNITLVGAGETTITATFAGDDTYYGSTGSYKLIVTNPDAVPVASLEKAFDAATTDEQDIYFDFTGLQVTAVNGSNAYLQDEDGFGAMIYQSGHGYQVGQVLNGAANCKFMLYRGALEFKGVTKEIVPVEATPEMQEVHQFYYETVTDLTAYNHGSFIKLANMTYTGQTANGNNINYNFTDATGAAFILYNTFRIEMPELTEGATYTLNGIFVVFNETHEIAPRNANDIVINKQDPTYNVLGLESVTTNGEFPFTVETRASGLNVELEQTELAELIPGTVVGSYTLKTNGSEGDIILNISTEEDATYYAKEEPYNVHISFSQGGEEPQFEIADGVFDFTAGVDYGSKCPEGNSNSIKTDEYTWIAGNVTLVTGGRHIWNEKSELKLYKSTDSQPTAGFVTLSVPQGYVITKVAFTFGQKNKLAAQDGLDTQTGIWTGISQSVTISTGTDRTDIDKIEVTYEEGTVPVEPTEVTIDVMNEDGTPMDEKIVMNVGETKNFTVYASNQAHVSYRGDNDEVATVEAATTLDGGIDGGIITAKAAGTMTITFTIDVTSNQPSAEKKISVTVVDNTEPQFEIEDGVFDFTAGVDYGSGIKTTSESNHYEEAPSTWTAGNITLVADVKYRWWENDATLRFYATGSMTFSAPAGYAITSIKSNVTLTGFTATDGELSGNTWTGEANAVTLTKAEGKSVNISNITVQYQKADTYTRDVAKGEYGTLCLPYKSYVSGATVYDIVGVVKDGDKLTDLGLEEHTGALEAGVAYVFHATSTQVVATLVGEAVKEAAQTVGLVGNLSAENIKTPDGCYVLVDGVLRQVQGGTAYIQTNRAYFDLSGVEAIEGEATAGVKYISISFEEDATGITELTEKTEATEGAIYNLQGQRVNSLQRGINIVGGKKVLVK